VLGISVTLVVLLAAYFLNRLVARNVLLVTRAIKDYGSGNYNARVSRRWKNEFGALANAFNAMAEKLQIESHSEQPEAGSSSALAGEAVASDVVEPEPQPEDEGDDAIVVLQDDSEADDAPLDDATIIQIRPES